MKSKTILTNPEGWINLGGMLHMNLRKSMEGPLSSLLWNLVHVMNDGVWHKFLKYADQIIQGAATCPECKGTKKHSQKIAENNRRYETVPCWCTTKGGCVRAAATHFLHRIGYNLDGNSRRYAIILACGMELMEDADWEAFTDYVENIYEEVENESTQEGI